MSAIAFLSIDAFIQERKQKNLDQNGGLKMKGPQTLNCCYFKNLAMIKNKFNKQNP